MIEIADEILVVISKMDSFIKELRKGIDKTEAVKNDIKREQRVLNKGLSSDIIKVVQGDVSKLINSSKSILDIMVRISINLNTAKTEFINADKDGFKMKALKPNRIYRGEEPPKVKAEKENPIPKLEEDILKLAIKQYIENKVQNDIIMDKLKVGDFDGASIELTGMDLENVLNAITMGEAGAAIEGFETLVRLGSKGYKLLKIGITGAKEALSKLTVEKVALAFAGAKGLEQIEETAENIKKEEGIIKTALESARKKLDDLYKIVYDGESGGKDIPPAFKQEDFASSYEARINQTPAEANVKVEFKGNRGESLCTLKPPPDPELKKILDKAGVDGIQYKNGVPDFSPVSKAEVEIKYMLGGKGVNGNKARNLNFEQANTELAKKLNKSSELAKKFDMVAGNIKPSDIEKYRVKNNLTWHELNDTKTIQLVPTKINSTFGHTGGVGEINAGAYKNKIQ
ncbi:HNH endonuclease [Clostridium felsineum]|uniref:HNH endonuclease n=1 Tax=Clostridium felsineum TaxID=36839 RepID=UPI0020341A68|nr:HNH endonuclease [Clostridium felsineum]